MLSSYILSLREGIEAALIIGIVLSALRQMHRQNLASAIWAGAGSAALLSLLTAILLTRLGLELKDPAEAIFEGITMLLAAGILTWMIFWMSQRARNMKAELEIRRPARLTNREMVTFWTGFYRRPARGRGIGPVPDCRDVFLERSPDNPGCIARPRYSHSARLVVFCNDRPARSAAFLPGDGFPVDLVCRRAGGARRG